MTHAPRPALGAVALLLCVGALGVAQDTVAAQRSALPFDTARLQPYRRYYNLVVQGRDSTTTVGMSETSLARATYAGAPSWLLVETRTGIVASAESLYVTPALRPVHWSSSLGAARLGTEFVGDSIYGAVTGPRGKQNIVLGGSQDLMVSTPMIAMLLPLLPLSRQWSDSIAVMAVDLATSRIIPAELSVVAEEELTVDSTLTRPTWVVALRAGARSIQFWVDKDIPAVLRVQQTLPPHTGTLLEYRLRAPPETPQDSTAKLPP